MVRKTRVMHNPRWAVLDFPGGDRGSTYHSMSFRSLDIIHARSNITIADCKETEMPEAKGSCTYERGKTTRPDLSQQGPSQVPADQGAWVDFGLM